MPDKDRRGQAPGSEGEPPRRFAETPPPSYPDTVDRTYLVETLMQMQSTLGELKAAVQHLTGELKTQARTLNRISHVIFAAGVVIAIVLSIGGFFLNKIWDVLIAALKASATH